MMYSGPFKISRILPVGYIPTEGNISLCAALYIWLNEPSYIITVKYIDGEFNEIFLYFFYIITKDRDKNQNRSVISYRVLGDFTDPIKDYYNLGEEYLFHPSWKYLCLHINFEMGNFLFSSNSKVLTRENLTFNGFSAMKEALIRTPIEISVYNSKIGPVSLFAKCPNEIYFEEDVQNANFSQWQFSKEKSKIRRINIQEVCGSAPLCDNIYYINAKLSFEKAVRICASMGRGTIPDIHDFPEWIKFDTYLVWYPAVTINGSYISYYNGTSLNQSEWFLGEPNANEEDKCILCDKYRCVNLLCEKGNEFFCQAYPLVRVRGLCMQQRLGTLYFGWQLNKELFWVSPQGTFIRFDKKSERWVAKNKMFSSIYATSVAPYGSFLLGTHPWNIYDPMCHNEEMIVNVSLTSCYNNDFNCNDGGCIPINYRCDGINDCHDHSDEADCTILNKLASQVSQYAPVNPANRSEFIIVTVSAEVQNILEINDKAARFSIRARINLSWSDARLQFLNLRKLQSLNSLSSESNLIWKPTLLFENQILSDLEQSNDPELLVDLNDSHSPILAERSQIRNQFIYDGKYNNLVWSTFFR